jgi:hypothetical protein
LSASAGRRAACDRAQQRTATSLILTLPITMVASCSLSVVAAFEYSGFSFCEW